MIVSAGEIRSCDVEGVEYFLFWPASAAPHAHNDFVSDEVFLSETPDTPVVLVSEEFAETLIGAELTGFELRRLP
jgi:hypothetical protein